MIRPLATTLGLCLLLLAFPAGAAADEIEWMYNPAAVVEMNFGDISEAELDELEAEPDEEVHGSFELKVDGVRKGPLLTDVGIRLKGGVGSSRPVKSGKSGFKVRFDKFVKGQLFFGIKRLTLNNMVQDPSMVHETMVYELFHGLGVPAPRTGYAFIRVNGEPYGVYLNIETYDEVMLPRLFPSTQHLFEADAAGVDVRPGEAGTFEVDEGPEGDLSDLEALIVAANDTVGDWSEGVEAVADLDEMTRMWAVERYAGNWDGYAGQYEDPLPSGPFRPNNYYLHSLDDGVFAMLPWGTDQTWGVPLEFDEPAGGLLFNNCLADASCKALYEGQLAGVGAAVSGRGLDQVAVCTAKLLAPWQAQEDPSRAEYDAAQIEKGVENTRTFLALRAAELADFLGDEPPSGVPDGTDPCLKPDPEKPTVPTSPQVKEPAPIIDIGPKLRISPTKVRGNLISTRIKAPAAGEVMLWVTAPLEGRRVPVCSMRRSILGPREVVARCRLTKAAREARADGPLRLLVRVGFIPEVGESRIVRRALTAPKHD
jgi:CotH kinase protein